MKSIPKKVNKQFQSQNVDLLITIDLNCSHENHPLEYKLKAYQTKLEKSDEFAFERLEVNVKSDENYEKGIMKIHENLKKVDKNVTLNDRISSNENDDLSILLFYLKHYDEYLSNKKDASEKDVCEISRIVSSVEEYLKNDDRNLQNQNQKQKTVSDLMKVLNEQMEITNLIHKNYV